MGSYRACTILCVLCGLTSGCTLSKSWSQTELDSWVGASGEELRSVWGSPNRTEAGAGSESLYIYTSSIVSDRRDEELDKVLRSDRTYENQQNLSDYPYTVECEMVFRLLEDRVVGAHSKGAGCDPKPRPGR